MGIEPTSDALTPLNGFEDRGGHQTSKLFPVVKRNQRNGFLFCTTASIQPALESCARRIVTGAGSITTPLEQEY